MITLRSMLTLLASLIVVSASVAMAPTSAAAATPGVRSVCVERGTQLMTTSPATRCRARGGRFFDLATSGKITLCLRVRAGQHRISGAARGARRCARGDKAVVLGGSYTREMCVGAGGVLRFAAATRPACPRGQRRMEARRGAADLSVSVTARDATVLLGDTSVVDVDLRNAGPVAATNVIVTLTSDAHVAITGTAATIGSVQDAAWSVPRVLPGSSARLRLEVRGSLVGTSTLGAFVQSTDQPDPDSTAGSAHPDEDDSARTSITVNVRPAARLAAGAAPKFGATAAGSTSSPQEITLRNDGTAASGTVRVARGGSDEASFDTAADTCSGRSLAAGATCTVAVTFAPSRSGSHTATLSFDATPGGSTAIELTGSALVPATLLVSPSSSTPFVTDAGTPTSSQTFSVANTGEVATSALTSQLSGTDAADFEVTSDTCTGEVLAPNATCAIDVRAWPASGGTKAATLRITDASGSDGHATLSATVRAAVFAFSVSLHHFGPVPLLSTSVPFSVTLTNVGDATSSNIGALMTGPPDGNQFSLVSGTNTCSGAPLAPNASCTLQYEFHPTDAGVKSTTVTAGAMLGGSAQFMLVGEGVSA